MKKRGFIFISIIFLYIFFSYSVSAECGTAPTNGCTVSQNTTFDYGTYNLPSGISIIGDGLNLDCNGSTIRGNGSALATRGINITTSNVVVKNCTVSGYFYGIYLSNLKTNHSLISNIIKNNFFGVLIGTGASNATLTSNIIENNYKGIDHTNYTNGAIFNKNQLKHNMLTTLININSSQLTNESFERTYSKYSNISFNLSIDDYNGSACPNFTYDFKVYPNQTVNGLKFSNTSNIVNFSFAPSKEGLYTIQVNITNSIYNITEIRNYLFLVGNTSKETTRYYFHQDSPKHGQPRGGDSGSLYRNITESAEFVYCGSWITFSPDEIAKPLGIIKNISIGWWYNVTGAQPNASLLRYADYSMTTNYDVQVSNTTGNGNYVWDKVNFSSLNITSDYAWRFYWLGIKLIGTGPWVYSNNTNSSYADFTSIYSGPKIEQFTEENPSDIRDMRLLSSIYLTDTKDNMSLEIEGEGNLTLAVNVSNLGIYSVYYDGNHCSNSNCTLNKNESGIVNVTLSLDSLHLLSINKTGTISVSEEVIVANPPNEEGGGNPVSTDKWISTQIISSEEFDIGYTQALSSNQRLQVSVDNEKHYVGVVSLTETSATIEVSSIPQKANLSIGEEKKFDITGDGNYDIQVSLNKIEDNKAEITIKKIDEKISEEKKIEEQIEKKQEEKPSNLYIILILIVIAIFIIYFTKRRKP